MNSKSAQHSQKSKSNDWSLAPGSERFSDAEIEKMEEERRLKRQERGVELREAFMSREVLPQAIERINNAVSLAAKNGHHQLQVVTFPCTFTSDGGRRINIADPEWPDTLEGFAKKAYEFYGRELRPLGYKLHAEIISFPGGMPGDVGLILKW
jgi:hypothetical protein